MAEQRVGGRPPVPLGAAVAVAVPGTWLGAAAYLGLPAPHLPAPLLALVLGVAIVGAALLLSWGAEAAQVDISAGLALAVLALLAVLPEYAVDFVFTLRAGQEFGASGECSPPGGGGADPCTLALANVTGANRVLVGVGWPLVVLVAGWAARRAGRESRGSTAAPDGVRLQASLSTELTFLGLATLYSLTLPLRRSLTLVDAGVLVALFVLYAWRLSKAPASEPDLIGTSQWVGEQPARRRRTWVIGMLVVAGAVILACAEHFADALVDTGSSLGVDEFLLVQWVAPLASESPELIVACLYAWRLKASDALGALLSSKVNQWTLLVGTIPIVFALASTSPHGLPLDGQQRTELLITAAQSLFAVALLVDRSLGRRGALALLVLFGVQFLSSVLAPDAVDRVVSYALSGLYALLAVVLLVRQRSLTARLVRDGVRTPFEELERRDEAEAEERERAAA